MPVQLEPRARELADYMSDLSEEAYSAGWMKELEFELWEAVVGGPRRYGSIQITLEHIAHLQRLSEAACGWIVFDDKEGESLVPMGEWARVFANWKHHPSPP